MTKIVVSGLPRSGTSMMMRCLEAGGIASLTDGERTADRDNPNGYYEFEPVKATKEDASWIESADGKSVKMVYSLIYDLPATHHYSVIVMRRHMDEILASQAKMLARFGFDSGPPDVVMEKLFNRELSRFQQWSSEQSHLSLIEVFYHDVVADPRVQFERISRFLEFPLDVDAMHSVIDPALYRNRTAEAAQ